MQRVIHLIEALRGANVPVPPFPYVEPVAATPNGRAVPSAEDLQTTREAFESRVEAWRQEVMALHRAHSEREATRDPE
jgi:hypothetical protein